MSKGMSPRKASLTWSAASKYARLQAELEKCEKVLIELSHSLAQTVQTDEGLRVTFNNPRREYNWIKVCEDFGVDYLDIQYVDNLSPLARAAFMAEYPDRADTLDEKYIKRHPVKPGFKLIKPTRVAS
jgi:hypothetical protein